MEDLEGVPTGASVDGGRRDSLTRWIWNLTACQSVQCTCVHTFATVQSLTIYLQEQSTPKKCSWDLAQYTGGLISNCFKSVMTRSYVCLTSKNLFPESFLEGAGKSWELKGFWKQSRAEMGKGNHNRLLQQVSHRDHDHHPHHDLVDQDRGGVAAGSNGEDPDNNGETEPNARRTQSVNNLSFFSN